MGLFIFMYCFISVVKFSLEKKVSGIFCGSGTTYSMRQIFDFTIEATLMSRQHLGCIDTQPEYSALHSGAIMSLFVGGADNDRIASHKRIDCTMKHFMFVQAGLYKGRH